MTNSNGCSLSGPGDLSVFNFSNFFCITVLLKDNFISSYVWTFVCKSFWNSSSFMNTCWKCSHKTSAASVSVFVKSLLFLILS